jgi:hypothetical protein
MKRFFCVSLCLAGFYDAGIDWASACPAVAVQSVVGGMAVTTPAMVGVQTLTVPTVQVQTLSVPTVQVQAFTTPIVVQQVVRQRPVRVRTRSVTRSGFGLGLF